MAHVFNTKAADGSEKHCWTWNGRLDLPTFQPSMLVRYNWGEQKEKRVCHSFVTDGRIQYLGDSTHALAGQTIDLPEVEGLR